MAGNKIKVMHQGEAYEVDAGVVDDGYVSIDGVNYDFASYNEWPPANGIYCTMTLPPNEFKASTPVYPATKI